MKKVLFLTNIPSPYRVDFFNELGKYCELTVLYEKQYSGERDDSWKKYKINNFKAIFLKGKSLSVDRAFCPSVIKYLKKNKYNSIIVTNFTDPTGIMAVKWLKLNNISYALESDGGFAKSGKGVREKFKKSIISGAKLYFSTADIHDEYYLTYGAKKENIVRYPFTSLYESDILKKVPTIDEKKKLRKKLGMTEEKIVLSVGQFIYRKGFDVLIKASDYLEDDIGIYIVGGTPTEEYIKLANEHKTKKIHFVDFKSSEDLKNYYQAADLFVLPTREDIWGLVINEAMANGLPIITTNRCLAGMELVNSMNGIIVAIDSVEEVAFAIKKIFEKEDKLFKMSLESINIIQKYCIENMVNMHIKYLKI